MRSLAKTEPCGEDWLDRKVSPVFLAVGRLDPQKDFSTLLRAVASVGQECRCRLIIIGEGKDRPHLSSVISELEVGQSVRLIGEQTNPYKFMGKADALVVSSRWEGFCAVIVEALALGIPVISTDCPNGPAELLEFGRFGRLVPVADSKALASAMLDFIGGDVVCAPEVLRQRADRFGIDNTLPSYLRYLGAMTE